MPKKKEQTERNVNPEADQESAQSRGSQAQRCRPRWVAPREEGQLIGANPRPGFRGVVGFFEELGPDSPGDRGGDQDW